MIFGIVLMIFVILYPMLVSIYVFLPLFIGFSGWMILRGVEGAGLMYVVIPLVYLINLEINLSLPLFLTLAAALSYYLFLYPSILFLKRCSRCVAILSVVLIDLIYLGLLVVYDFIFETGSIDINYLLLYSLVMDILAVVIL
jgi:hypothetical protein